jgi:membrane-associated phospholipid phosphatase
MTALVSQLDTSLVQLDTSLVHGVADVRFGAATSFFVLASAWWVKSAFLIGIGGVADAWKRRFPTTIVWAGLAAGLAAVATSGLKELFDRVRPPVADPSFAAAVAVPGSASFPSGHASTAFAAAVAIALCHPRLRLPALAIATAVAVSRVYLGVHYPSDVLVGALLGSAIGAATVFGARALLPSERTRPVPVVN